MSLVDLESAAVKRELEQRIDKLWGYVRDYRNSLSSETHCRRIREMVLLPLPSFEREIRSLKSERDGLVLQLARSRNTAKKLRRAAKEKKAVT